MVELKTVRGFLELFWSILSAFANTDGGIILLGVKEDKNKCQKTTDDWNNGYAECEIMEAKKQRSTELSV